MPWNQIAKRVEARLVRVREAGAELAGLDQGSLRDRAAELRRRARRGESLSALEPETFALVCEAAHHTLGLAPFDVQILAGLAMQDGNVAEMGTGEGKTLAAVLPACLNALGGRGVHLLTFNDYLARRDAAWMGPVYDLLGLRVASAQSATANPKQAPTSPA